MRPRITLTLTPKELDEIINCVSAATDHGLAVGHKNAHGLPGGRLTLLENYRARFGYKIEQE